MSRFFSSNPAKPRVTVLMPVYNCEHHVARSIKSILRQTFSDFEFLIIDDGSTDSTDEVILSFSDKRINYIHNERNIGVANTLNRGLKMAKGEYIVRMDSDDISRPMRIERQVKFMDSNPSIGISGTFTRLFGSQLPVINRRPIGPSVVDAFMVFDNPISHPTAILRRQFIIENELRYDPQFNRTEDYELWCRCRGVFLLDNLPELLLMMRIHKESVTGKFEEIMRHQTENVLRRQLQTLDVSPSQEELSFHHAVGRGKRLFTRNDMRRAHAWLLYLQYTNRLKGVYENHAMATAIGMIWFRLCANSTPLGPWIWNFCKISKLRKGYTPSRQEIAIFWTSIIWHYLYRIKLNLHS